MSNPTSVRLSDKASKALKQLRDKPGGFNLNRFISESLVSLAEKGEIKWPKEKT